MTLSIATGGALCGTDDALALSTGGVICTPDVNLDETIVIDNDIASRIYNVLVRHSEAREELRDAFVHHMSDEGTGRGLKEWLFVLGFFKPTDFLINGNEWIVITTLNDTIPDRTQKVIDTTNLELALLRDIVIAE